MVFTAGQGLTIRGLTIAEPGAEGPRAELIEIEELQLACRADLRDLALHDPEITDAVVRRGKLWITRRRDGSWSAAKLFPWPKLSDHSPPLRVENASIEIFDPLRTPAATLVLRDVNLDFPATGGEGAAATPGVRHFRGAISGDHVRQIAVEGAIDPERLTWSVAGTVDGLDVAPELREGLPEPLASRLAPLRGVYGRSDLAFRASYDPATQQGVQYAVSGRLLQGRVEDPRLPYPLADLQISFRCDNLGFALDEFSARHGQTQLRLTCRAVGYELTGPLVVAGELRRLTLEPRLHDFLPQRLKEEWDKYFPAGQVDLDFKFTYDGARWSHEATLACRNGSFCYDKFPYRIEQAQGTLVFKDHALRVDLTAPGGGAAPYRITAEAVESQAGGRSGWSGWFDAKGEELPLDERLLVALPENARKVVRTLNPQGSCNFHVHISRAQPEEPLHKYASVYLNRCTMRFDHFPYPVRNIRGCLEMFDRQWTFTDLAGANDTGQFTCQGSLQPSADGGDELYLNIAGSNVALNKDLREALRPNMQQLWSSLQPHGAVDLTAQVRFQSRANQFHVAVQAQPQTESSWIEPVHFPYRLEKLRGAINYCDGVVTLDRIRAEHGASKAAAAGRCEFRPDGSWLFRLEGLTVDRLPLDRELIQALPDRLRRTISALNPSGPINLRGALEFEHGSQSPDPPQARWDVVLGVQRGSLDCGLKLENINGEVSLTGAFDGASLRSRGELALDSISCRDRHFSQVLGPLWIDDNQVLLGSLVDRPRGSQAPPGTRQPRPITAKVFGGSVYGDAWIQLGPSPRYGAQATVTDLELAQIMRDLAAGRQNLGGKIQATIDLHGSGRSLNGLGGHGVVRLRQGDVYELPLMVAMLKILSVRRPDKQAFNQCDIEYRISGSHAYLDRIHFSGDAVSLDGKGDVDFSGKLQLDFHAIIGRSTPRLPLVREFMGEASQQIMLIHVGGTLQDPQVRNEALPGVNQAIQTLASPGGLLPGLNRN